MCKYRFKYLILEILTLMITTATWAQTSEIEFRRIPMDEAFASSQVNCIMRDSRGYVWMGTQYGMVRYDGFRFSVFLHINGVSSSLPNNMVDEIQEDRRGRFWVHTLQGYCVYDSYYESFDTDIHNYLGQYGINGNPQHIYIDDEKNMWITVEKKGLYKIDAKTDKTTFLAYGRQVHNAEITCIHRNLNKLYLNFIDGYFAVYDAKNPREIRHTDFIMKHRDGATSNYNTFVDDRGDLWVTSDKRVFVYGIDKKTWYDNVYDHFKALGYKLPFEGNILIKDIKSDLNGHLWVATDHKGLFMFDHADRSVHQFLYNRLDPRSIPDNTIQCLYVDSLGALWLGSYKNGLAYYSQSENRFETIDLGDICTITQDFNGLLWCGSNDNGIVTYDLVTKNIRRIDKSESGLGTNTIVTSLTARDGSLWFGTYNGGMARYKDGQWKVWRAGNSGLLNDNVWYLTQVPDGRIAIGTLGSGVQIFDPETEKFTNYNMSNSPLTSDFISSLAISNDNRLIASHSEGLSIIDIETGKIENMHGSHSGIPFSSQQFNQVYEDSRGIIWCATLSGVNAYNPKNDSIKTIVTVAGVPGSVACSITEDAKHNIWIVNEHSVSIISVKKTTSAGKFDYFATTFNKLDGLQERLFNYRSIRLLRNGDIVVGGQDGINIIPPQQEDKEEKDASVLFSGLVLFDHPLRVGEEYNGRVILEDNPDESHKLKLKYSENAFSIMLASSEITVPQKSRFCYRLKGFSDKWITTTEGQNAITFTNLLPGTYTLEARVITRDGTLSNKINRLKITIAPPFYLSVWAIILYLIILALGIWYWRRTLLRRQKTKFEMAQYQNEVKRTREIEEIKLNFFTNVSHELRTPLMLIISPLQALLKKEDDPSKHKSLELIYRNAQRLLEMVGQILDFRKVEKNKETLNLISGDIVGYVRNIVKSFQSFGGKNISLEFHSPVESFNMAFDSDKMRKIIDNLLSNAMKYTPDGGRVDVSMRVKHNDDPSVKDMIEIAVADNGVGISDEDKKHIFERFYMAHNVSSPYGGTGVGLSLAHDFALLHGGDITVADNKGGGTIFTVTIPIRHEASLIPSKQDELKEDKEKRYTTTTALKTEIPSEGVELSENTDTSDKAGSTHPLDKVGITNMSDKAGNTETSYNNQRAGISDKVAQPKDSNQKRVDSLNHAEVDILNQVGANSHNENTEDSSKGNKGKPEVLVVDDSRDFLDFMNEELGQHFAVRTAENGREALDKISEHKPDLIISDVMMPVMDGNELCRTVKANKHTADIPFVMLTARLAQEHQVEGLANGADEYITKPFNLDVLYMRIHNLLKWHNIEPDKQAGKLQPELKHVEVTSMDKQLVEKATAYVDDNIRDSSIGVESMAKALGMSRVQLYKRILPITGSTPIEFIRQIRLRRAEQLLRESQMSVSEVAYNVGFNNPRYFSKYFKEMYGVMPSQYKKKK